MTLDEAGGRASSRPSFATITVSSKALATSTFSPERILGSCSWPINVAKIVLAS